MQVPTALQSYVQRFKLPQPDSHKGQNGKLLIIGGSELFHAASKWSLDVAAQLVDMVFYASVPGTNELVREAKAGFWNGIVIPRTEIANYIAEADAVLIGPGMERQADLVNKVSIDFDRELTADEWHDTDLVTHHLLVRYPQKQWVIDAGALQMLRPEYLPAGAILTPHQKELEQLLAKLPEFVASDSAAVLADVAQLKQVAAALNHAVLLIKGSVDVVATADELVQVAGGNAGMTKGGTGDVLAGLVAALACTQEKEVAAVIGSLVNKQAGEKLHEQQGVYFGASQLAAEVPRILWEVAQLEKSA